MGYLINPIAFRVGHTTNWDSVWFAHREVYPEFLHFVLKIRFYFNNVLSSFPTVDDLDMTNKNIISLFRLGILYSHFRIIFDFTSVNISLFFYPGHFWANFNNVSKKKNRIGVLFSGLILGLSRNPLLENKLFQMTLLGFALCEAMGLLAIMMAFLILYS